MAATTSSARKPTAKLTVPAKSGSPVLRARCPLAACCSALAAPAATAKSEEPDVQVRAGAEGRGDDRGDRQRHARDAPRGDALVAGGAQPDAVGGQAPGRLAADERDAQQRHPDLGRADRAGGDEHRAAQAAEQVPAAHLRQRAQRARDGAGGHGDREQRDEPDAVVDRRRGLARADRLAQPAVDVGLHARARRPPRRRRASAARSRGARRRPRVALSPASACCQGAARRAPRTRRQLVDRPRAPASSESRSRTVTVRSSSDWWSIVTQHGVPISSWRR